MYPKYMPSRRIRDKHTGTYKLKRIYNGLTGSGLGDVLNNMTTSVFSKLTGETVKKIASDAASKAITTGASKVGEKVGDVIAEKIDEKFIKRSRPRETVQRVVPIPKAENKGEMIMEILRESNKTSENSPAKNKLSQQFDELLFM